MKLHHLHWLSKQQGIFSNKNRGAESLQSGLMVNCQTHWPTLQMYLPNFLKEMENPSPPSVHGSNEQHSFRMSLSSVSSIHIFSPLICPTEKLLLCLKQEHCMLCSSPSLIFSLFHCQKRYNVLEYPTIWYFQSYNFWLFGFFLFIYFVFPPNTLPPTKSKISNFPGHSAVGIPHLPTASQHPRELLMGCKPPKFSFYYCFSVWNPNTFSTQCFQWQRAAKHEGRQNHLLIHGTTRVVLGFFKAKI